MTMTRILAFGVPLFVLTVLATAYITSRATTCDETSDSAQAIQFAWTTRAETETEYVRSAVLVNAAYPARRQISVPSVGDAALRPVDAGGP